LFQFRTCHGQFLVRRRPHEAPSGSRAEGCLKSDAFTRSVSLKYGRW
jgi:hypothetical protein